MLNDRDDRVCNGAQDVAAIQRRLTARYVPHGSWVLHAGDQRLDLDTDAAVLLGIDPLAHNMLDQFMERVAKSDRGRWLRLVMEHCRTGAPLSTHLMLEGVNGSLQRVDFQAEVVAPDTCQAILAGIVIPFQPGRSEPRLEDFVDMAEEWLWETDAQGRFTFFSPGAALLWGKTPIEDILGKTRAELLSDRNDVMEMDMHLAWIAQKKAFRDFRFWRRCDDGQDRYVSSTGKPIVDDAGNFLGYRGTGRDLTEQQRMREELLAANRQLNSANKAKSDAMGSLKEANALLEEQFEELERVQEEVRHKSLHDPLTGVANRRFLDTRLAESAEKCREQDDWLGVLHIDLDRFKQINDTLGHAAGDAVLAHVAATLEDHAGEDDLVARVGGDEFVVVRTSNADQTELGELAQTLIEALGKPYIHDGRECWFGASVGIAAMRGEEIVSDELLMNADIALYRAKNRGRGCYQHFSNEVQQEMIRHKVLADGIRAGLERDEFVPWYQPQIDAQTREIQGFEALARWHCPDGSVRPPVDFLGVAEDLSVVPRIDHMILAQSLSDLSAWDAAGLDVPHVSVNVSARRLLDPDLVTKLDAFDLPRGRVAFELLESAFLDDMEETLVWNIDQLKEKGIDIQLDDFGSGHASIVSLVKLGPDALKIDRQMISAITLDPARLSVVESIISIGHSLGVRIIAEGVETEEQAQILADLGCHGLQGYLISRPMPAIDVPGFVQNWRGEGQRAQA
ncbi:MAG: EAL domain-containing protein [Paracoccaceae bacterium]